MKEYTSPQSSLHTIDGEHATHFSELHKKSCCLQPLQCSTRLQQNLEKVTRIYYQIDHHRIDM